MTDKDIKEDKCPICGSNNVEYFSEDWESLQYGDNAYHSVKCLDCKAEYIQVDKIQFSHYIITENGIHREIQPNNELKELVGSIRRQMSVAKAKNTPINPQHIIEQIDGVI